MTLKILGGKFGGRLLKSPKGSQTRPTMSMLKKAVFDILQPVIQDAIFLDLFSGSGSMGIEALSRGAKQVIFVDAHREAMRCLNENLALLKIKDQAVVLHKDIFKALTELQKMQIVCDIIYADPPYDRDKLYLELLTYLDNTTLLRPQGVLFLESPVPSPFKDLSISLKHLHFISSRRYGASEIYEYIHI